MPKDKDAPEEKELKEELVPKSKLADRDAEIESLRKTLRALEGHTPPPAQQAPAGSNQLSGMAKIIAEEMGWDQKAVYENLILTDRYASTVVQQQIYPILNGLADKIDGIEARQLYPDYSKYEAEIETERQARSQRGQYLQRSEAYHLIRGRNLDRIVEEKVAAAAPPEEKTPPPADDTAKGTQKAGPIGGTRLPTHDEIVAMTPEQRKAELEARGAF